MYFLNLGFKGSSSTEGRVFTVYDGYANVFDIAWRARVCPDGRCPDVIKS